MNYIVIVTNDISLSFEKYKRKFILPKGTIINNSQKTIEIKGLVKYIFLDFKSTYRIRGYRFTSAIIDEYYGTRKAIPYDVIEEISARVELMAARGRAINAI